MLKLNAQTEFTISAAEQSEKIISKPFMYVSGLCLLFLVAKTCIYGFAATEHTVVTCSSGDDCHCH